MTTAVGNQKDEVFFNFCVKSLLNDLVNPRSFAIAPLCPRAPQKIHPHSKIEYEKKMKKQDGSENIFYNLFFY